jgi:CheY-like chemotaxis protein
LINDGGVSGVNQSPVLIVDDFGDALDMYQEYLSFKGYQVLVARSGADAISLARSHRPALIFMDLRMPSMTGTEAMHELRADPAFANVPIIAFTAHALEDERLSALASGFDEVIAKPCNPDDLISAIERLLITAER